MLFPTQAGTKGRCISLTFGNNSHKAVLTIEAAAVLPFFACFLVFVLYFSGFCRCMQALHRLCSIRAEEWLLNAACQDRQLKKSRSRMEAGIQELRNG